MAKKYNVTWYRDEVDINNSVKRRWFIVPKKVEQINEYLFIDKYKWNIIKIGRHVMKVNDINEAWSIPEKSVLK